MAYWRFDEASGGTSAADSSGNSNHGTLENGAAFINGRINNSVNLDGSNDDVLAANSSTLNPSAAITVAAWFTASSTGTYQFLVNKFNHGSGTATDDSYTLGLDPTGKLYWQVETNPGAIADNLMVVTPPVSVLDGQFHHIAATYDGAAMKVYLDGSVAGSINASGPMLSSSTSVLLGASLSNGVKAYYQSGRLDEARVYNQALIDTDIQTLAQPVFAPAAYWKFDEASGTTAADSSANGNTGTLTNGPVWTTGRINGGVSLDGMNDHVAVANSASLNPSSAITVAAWFKANPTAGYQFLVNKFNHASGTAADDSYALGLDPTGKLYWQVETNPGSGIVDNIMITTPPVSVRDGQFHHIAAIYDGLAMRVFLDSSQVGSINASGAMVASSTPAVLGAGLANSGTTYFQNGVLDEARIYNQALIAGDVQALFSNTPPSVSITSPASGATFTAPASITINASASDNGTITKVDFYQGTTLLGADTAVPYSFNWTGVAASSYSLTAKATDNWGLTTTSSAVNIVVNPGAAPVPRDGLALVSYDQNTNRISTAGWEYDAAGNQTRVQRADGSWQRYVYDAAGRLVKVQNDSSVTQIIHTYAASNHRLIEQVGDENFSQRTYYAWAGDSVIAEYEETQASPTTPKWVKSYVYLGGRLLATIAPSGASERVEYHHPDRLGTRLVTNNQDTSSFEQVTLPFGTALDAESSGSTKRRFTSYDRSTVTGLDYAVNRHYDPLQGRFTQVDPIGMGSVSLVDPQSLNLHAYCGNDPVNHLDPSGLGFFSFLGKVFSFFAKIAKWVAVVVSVAVIVAAVLQVGFDIQLLPILGNILSKLGIIQLGGVGASFAAGAGGTAVGVGLGATSYVLGGLAAAGAVNDFMQRRRETPQNPGGQFTPDQQVALRLLTNSVEQLLLRNPDCANVLGGTRNAQAVFNRANVRSANTINPNYRGTGGRFPGVARRANSMALNPRSDNVAFSEVSVPRLTATNIYLNDRFFTKGDFLKRQTVFIHELNRNNGYLGTDRADYANIIKACGTGDPYGP